MSVVHEQQFEVFSCRDSGNFAPNLVFYTCILVREVLRLADGTEEAVFLLLDGVSVPKPGASLFLIFLKSINSQYTHLLAETLLLVTFGTMLSEVACFLTALKAT